MENSQKNTRAGRVWQIVFYPESCPPDYQNIIYSWHIPACLSPLHNPLNNSSVSFETENKAHYHLNLYFDGNKSYEQILELSLQLNSKRIERVENTRTMTRYLIHIDDPDKEQFSLSDIIPFGGVSYIDYFVQDFNGIDACDRLENFISENCIDNMGILVNRLKEDNLTDLLNYVRFKNAFYIGKLLDGQFQINRRNDIISDLDLNEIRHENYKNVMDNEL